MLHFGPATLIALCFGLACSQDSTTDSSCSKQPIVQNFYSTDIFSAADADKNRSNIARGKTGRIGPLGPPGPKGSKVILLLTI